MRKLSIKALENAQGMTEFALVLPILLLVILGVFAFGHMFFVYASVVSASREAARFGAAVGEVQGSGGVVRYVSCDQIRDAGTRVGTFAGVTPNAINITYDEGPGTTTGRLNGVNVNCPVGGPGPNPDLVDLGDRILVTVTVQYEPIVPLIPIPSFPITATTARTIVKSLPVGVAPTAEPLCPFTSVSIAADYEPSVVGQPVNYTVSVSADDGTTPGTNNAILFQDIESGGGCSDMDAPSDSTQAECGRSFTYTTVGEKAVAAQYLGDGGMPCYEPGNAGYTHLVNPASTSVRITADTPDPSKVNERVTVTATVTVNAPGAGTPTGTVTIYDTEGRYSCSATINAAGQGSCTIRPSVLGLIHLRADYSGDANYFASSTTTNEPHLIYDPTTPTVEPEPTVPAAPSPTPIPNCPSWSPKTIDFSKQNNTALEFEIAAASANVTVQSVKITWPELPTANLLEIRFDDKDGGVYNNDSCRTTGNDKNCLYKTPSGTTRGPTTQTITDSSSGWGKYGDIPKNTSKAMRLWFDHALATGYYTIEVGFTNGCVIKDIQGYRP